MAFYKCCVSGCDSTSKDYRLFCMPKNDKLRNLWMSFIAPSNPDLLLLTKTQVLKKRVCIKHFDKNQFDYAGVRIRYSYPCLLSEKEIHHGVPLSGKEHRANKDHNYIFEQTHKDHNYCSLDERDISISETETPVIMGEQECAEDNGHNYCTLDNSPINMGNEECAEDNGHNYCTLDNSPVNMGNEAEDDLLLVDKCQQTSEDDFIEHQFTNTLSTSKDEACSSTITGKSVNTSNSETVHLQECTTNTTFQGLAENIVFECGMNENIVQHLKTSTREWDEEKKLCSIVFDEVALTPNLQNNENWDKINGSKELGERKQELADHALVFMITGLCTAWRQILAYYFYEGTVSSAELQKILKEMIPRLYETGLKPLALVCDQSSTFSSCFKTLKRDTVRLHNNLGRKYDGTIHIAGVDLFCFFDPTHLLNGIRNNFVNKDILWINGKTASWKDIQYIYDVDNKSGHTRALPKLTAENTDPKQIKKMKVKAAAHVLSTQTASMLHYTYEVHKRFDDSLATMETTAETVEFFGELFDSVNGSPEGGAKGRLRCAVHTNSPHEDFWKSAIENLKSIKFIFKSTKLSGKPRYIRVVSLDGWIITIESFLGLSKLLFNKYGVENFYPKYIKKS